MRKKQIASVLCAAVFLSGCARLKSGLQTKILDESGLADDPDYQRYMTLLDQGLLDETGIYMEPETEGQEESKGEGRIHVTFAENPRIRARFYSDAGKSAPLSSCDVNPGDRIYIDTPVASHALTDLFSASRFRFVSYDSEYEEVWSEIVEAEGGGSYITIPEDCPVTEVSVQPLGNYDGRVVYLSDYTLDEEGRRHEQHGEWTLNEEVFTEAHAEIPSSMDLDPLYQYDPAVYRFISSEPEAYFLDETKGIIRFAHEDALGDHDRYEIELQKYLTVTINGTPDEGIISAFVNGGPAVRRENTLMKISREDQLVIFTEEGYTVTSDDLVSKGDAEKTEEGVAHTFDVPEDAPAELSVLIHKDTDTFQPLAVANAELTLKKSDGTEFEEDDSADPEEEVTLSLKPVEGYYITGDETENNAFEKTMTYGGYLESVDQLINTHRIMKYVTVTLEEKGDHGSSEYTLDKEAVSETVNGLKVGDRIKVRYTLTDKNWKFHQESGDVLSNIAELVQSVFSPKKRTVYIRINAQMDEETLNGEHYVEIVKRGQ